MKINDEKLFRHYYDVRKEEHINIQQFIEDYFLQITPKTFLRKYREWLQMNNLEYIYWSVEEYINWYAKHFQIDQEIVDLCMDKYNKIKGVNLKFSNLTIATSLVFVIGNIGKEELKSLSGISLTPINQCINVLQSMGIDNNINLNTNFKIHSNNNIFEKEVK